MKDEIKKGQAFIGMDNNKYYFLGLDFDEEIFYTTLRMWNDHESYMSRSNMFIKEILDEKSEIIESCTWYYQSMKEFEKSSMEEKIKRCLDIIKNSNTEEFELRPTDIESLVRGQVFSKEFNQYYEVIGFIVNNNVYLDSNYLFNQKGFFAIYHSDCNSMAPLIFERNIVLDGVEDKHFIAGNDDIVDIEEIICDKDFVNDYINEVMKKRLEKIKSKK